MTPSESYGEQMPSPAHLEAGLAPGIAYSRIPARLAGKTRTPRDVGYDDVRSTYTATGTPGLVILAEDAEDVSAAVRFAAAQSVPLAIRSGGYGVAGTSTNAGGIVLDVSRIKAIEVLDPVRRRLRIGTGATWGEVAEALAERGWSMTAGNAGDVGVGGLASAAGIGWLVRRYGLAIDQVTAADIVLADGSLIRADAEQHADIFWSIRGAGGTLGVITALEMTAIDVNDVVLGVIMVDATNVTGFVQGFFDRVADAPRELTTFVNLQAAQAGQPAIAQIMAVWCTGDDAAAVRAFEPLLTLGPVLDQQAQIIPYHAMVPAQREPLSGQQQLRLRNGFVSELTPEGAEAIAGLLERPEVMQLELRSLGGAVADVPTDATAFGHRDAKLYLTLWYDPESSDAIDEAWAGVTAHITGSYGAQSSDTRPAAVRAAYPPKTYQRLVELKKQYDPGNLFGPQLFPDLN